MGRAGLTPICLSRAYKEPCRRCRSVGVEAALGQDEGRQHSYGDAPFSASGSSSTSLTCFFASFPPSLLNLGLRNSGY